MLIDGIYQKLPIDGTESFSCPGGDLAALENFQAEVARADALADEGVIAIELRHAESHSGHDYVDVLRIRRLR